MMSDLFSETFTIINQVPISQTNPDKTKTKYKKHFIHNCGKRNGIFDKSNGTMAYRANAWTVWCKDWKLYKPPIWTDDGYYTLGDDEKDDFFTANVGDLVVFAEIPDVEPTTVQEFQTLVTKYKDNGGTITQAQSYINYHAGGTPWATNHIEMIKG